MDVCVFGAGSLGSLVGGLLADAHDVTLVGRQQHVDAVRSNGLSITGAFERTVEVEATTEVPTSTDLAIVTVKSFDTDAAARELSTMNLAGALSLQNGMANEEQLAAVLECEVLAGTCTYGARLTDLGAVECTGLGRVVLGPYQGGISAFAEEVGAAFDGALETTVSADMPRHLWEKLAINAGINAATALARVPNGALVDGPGESVVRQAARETARVAREQGVSLDAEEVAETTVSVAEATARNNSSMLQDVESGNRTEVDAINGYVVEQAAEPVPVNETLTALVRTWETEHGLRE